MIKKFLEAKWDYMHQRLDTQENLRTEIKWSQDMELSWKTTPFFTVVPIMVL